MNQAYQELINNVSQHIAQTFLTHESHVTQRALLVDADIAEITSISHHGRSEAVIRALHDFGSEESFEHAAKRFTEHYHYALSSSTASRVTREVAEEALKYVEEKLSRAGESDEHASQYGKMVEHMLIELDACKIRTATLEAIENTEKRTPVYTHPKKRKIIQWRDVRMGLSRPLDSLSKTYVGKMGSYPDVVEHLFQASVLEGMSAETNVVGVADGGNGLKESLEVRFPNLQFILDKTQMSTTKILILA